MSSIISAPTSASRGDVQKASPEGLWLGLDTGGTFTDAVLLADGRRVLAHSYPAVMAELRSIAELARPPDHATQFAFRNPDRALPAHLPALERRVWDALALTRRHRRSRYDPAGSQDYAEPEPALEHARRVSRALALAAARRAGAADPHVETSVTEKLAHVGPGTDYLAEAVARSTATGRPFAGHTA